MGCAPAGFAHPPDDRCREILCVTVTLESSAGLDRRGGDTIQSMTAGVTRSEGCRIAACRCSLRCRAPKDLPLDWAIWRMVMRTPRDAMTSDDDLSISVRGSCLRSAVVGPRSTSRVTAFSVETVSIGLPVARPSGADVQRPQSETAPGTNEGNSRLLYRATIRSYSRRLRVSGVSVKRLGRRR